MEDYDLDEQLLSVLRQAWEADEANRTRTTSDLASSVGESEERVQTRLEAMEAEGKVKRSPVAPDRWMIVVPSD